jgi:hypothetical protein
MACGKLTGTPCTIEGEAVAKELDAILLSNSLDPRRLQGDRGSEIHFRRMSSALELMEDPDYQFLKGVAANGVPIGVGVELPRTPAVFEEKTAWKLEEDTSDSKEYWGENHAQLSTA